jgi:hypothetical protein
MGFLFGDPALFACHGIQQLVAAEVNPGVFAGLRSCLVLFGHERRG